MVDTMVRFEEFMDRVREKLGIQGRFKVKVKDEGDFITVGDRDDWDLATQGCRQEARKEGGELGKMEVCRIFFLFSFFFFFSFSFSLFSLRWVLMYVELELIFYCTRCGSTNLDNDRHFFFQSVIFLFSSHVD